MKILFIWSNPGYVIKYGATVELLAQRGHRIHLGFDKDREPIEGVAAQLATLSERFPNVTFGSMPPADKRDAWLSLATSLRSTMDYLRYLQPRYRTAFSLRGRMEERATAWQRKLGKVLSYGGPPAIGAAIRLLRLTERAVPSRPVIDTYIRDQQPDVVLVSPLVEPGSVQVDYLKSAQVLGIHTGLAVHSWDNLTNKGLMRIVPERVFVWNAVQKDEAVRLHGVPARRVVMTGAQAFDDWFTRTPSVPREQFCRKVGLDPSKPFLLYLGSSYFIAPDEAGFCERWIRAIRGAADPVLADAGVLIRPHPKNADQFGGFPYKSLGNVAMWPPLGQPRVGATADTDFFDSMYYAAGCMGINTSAQIEAGIVGRPVFTLRAPEFAHSQDGTLHFSYLMNVNGGLLHAADDMNEHLRQLTDAVHGRGDAEERGRRFVEAFVRPFGRDVAATPLLADAIEELGQQPAPRRAGLPLWAYPLRGVLKIAVKRVERRLAAAPTKVKAGGGERPPRVYSPTRLVKQELAMRAALETGDSTRIVEAATRARKTKNRERDPAAANGREPSHAESATQPRKLKKVKAIDSGTMVVGRGGTIRNGSVDLDQGVVKQGKLKPPKDSVNSVDNEDSQR